VAVSHNIFRVASKLEERIESLRHLRTAVPGEAVLAALRKGLQDRANLVVAEAAKTIAALRLVPLISDLLASFARLFDDVLKTDPKCWGKMAIVQALTQLDYDQSPPFVRGLSHIQMEPIYGGNEDSAGQLRALCALALVQSTDLRRIEIMRLLTDAMTDSEDPVRAEAVRAIAQLGGDEAVLLLRLKARIGDNRPLVLGQVFDSVIALESEIGVRFVADYLSSPVVGIRDESALSLGASRRADAVSLLIATWHKGAVGDFGGVILRALSSSRHPDAIDFLFELVRMGSSADCAAALAELESLEGSDEVRTQIETAKRQRSET
jgi:HEAT repeat protein